MPRRPHWAARALMTFSVMSMRPLAKTASCRIRSNFSCSAIWLMMRVARSCTLASSSLRRMLRSSRTSRCLRWKSRLMSARRRSLSRRVASGMVTFSRSSSLCRSRPSFSSFARSALRALNSRSRTCCARFAGAASRKTRSVFTKPILSCCAPATRDHPSSTNAMSILMGRASEDLAQLELEPLDLVPRLLGDRLCDREAQRTHRGIPAYREAGGIAKVGRPHALVHAPDVAEVEEERQADVPFLVPRHREEHLGIAHHAAVAAEDVAVDVARAERRRLVAPHRAHAAGIEVLEERQRLVPVARGVAEFRVQHEREPAEARGRRPEELALVRGAVVQQVAGRHADFEPDFVQPASRGPGQAVARIPCERRIDAQGIG